MYTECIWFSEVSYVIRDAEEKQHLNGINAMQLDPNNGKLYSAGRDAIIRVWNSRLDTNEKYMQSMEHHNDWVNDIVLCCNGRNCNFYCFLIKTKLILCISSSN